MEQLKFDKNEFKEMVLNLNNNQSLNIKTRGFEVVDDKYRKHKGVEITMPARGDNGSAGYDICTPVDCIINPNQKVLIWTDLKAYMLQDEVLKLFVRSSIGIKKGVILSNITGIIDKSYYNNSNNNGNIGLALWNTSDETVKFEAGERICQGIFEKYLICDNDFCIHNERSGGIGSSGK